MEITKTIVIVVLSVLLLIAILVIWALSEKQYGEDNTKSSLRETLNSAHRYIEKLSNERQDWKNAYQREKRLSDHRARRIESLQRGEIIRTLKQIASGKDGK